MNTAPTDSFLYFAYGSNLLSRRLLERTPSARKLSTGVLKQHELRWHLAATDGSGKCDVVAAPEPTAEVHGVVWQIALADKPRLDAAESLGVGYDEKQALIETQQGSVQAWLYGALRIDPNAVPYDWYHALVLNGAQEHALPSHYLQGLQGVHRVADPDSERAARHYRLLQAESDE